MASFVETLGFAGSFPTLCGSLMRPFVGHKPGCLEAIGGLWV